MEKFSGISRRALLRGSVAAAVAANGLALSRPLLAQTGFPLPKILGTDASKNARVEKTGTRSPTYSSYRRILLIWKMVFTVYFPNRYSLNTNNTLRGLTKPVRIFYGSNMRRKPQKFARKLRKWRALM